MRIIMELDIQGSHLSSIQTYWTIVCSPRAGAASEIKRAQDLLLERYSRAVHRYLLGATRDPETAEELAQEFALRFVRGDLHGAERARGRFRDFVKGVLYHLIADHYRRKQKTPKALPEEADPADDAESMIESDRQFLESWRAELLDRAWKRLERLEEEGGQPYHTVLRFRAEHPDLHSRPMAEQLSERLKRPTTDVWVRQTLHRARERYAEMLLTEVMQTLRDPSLEQIEQELIDVGLWTYCEPALEKLRGKKE
jgi:RNA polymerase sigma-70 factor (ECF subfamily)